ncbi:hypothetical protein LFM09_28590 [Lentzea alba]|uniref:hypothetical protein n=1 Tax=Lentzea alba TaxID=2714351 RepID=UPI0039BEEE07
MAIVLTAIALLAGAAIGTTAFVLHKRDAGTYTADKLPTCDDIAAKDKTLPATRSDEAIPTGHRCRFTNTATGKVVEFQLAISTISEQRAEFDKYLESGYVRANEGRPGEASAWKRHYGYCSLVVLDSNATFKIDLRDPALVDDPESPVDPEWLCETSVRLMWLDYFLLAKGA